MMICRDSYTTRMLERYSRRYPALQTIGGYGILESPQNAAGRYFISRIGSKVLTRWVSLGWTRKEAEETIRRFAWELEAEVTDEI